MSLIIAPKHTKTISDIYENILFEFPENTLLDNILPDLWSEILKYQVVPFIIGDPNLTYPGFHLISKDEFLDCVDDIMEYYHSNKGISNVFDLDTKTNFHFLIGDHYAVNMAREIET